MVHLSKITLIGMSIDISVNYFIATVQDSVSTQKVISVSTMCLFQVKTKLNTKTKEFILCKKNNLRLQHLVYHTLLLSSWENWSTSSGIRAENFWLIVWTSSSPVDNPIIWRKIVKLMILTYPRSIHFCTQIKHKDLYL